MTFTTEDIEKSCYNCPHCSGARKHKENILLGGTACNKILEEYLESRKKARTVNNYLASLKTK